VEITKLHPTNEKLLKSHSGRVNFDSFLFCFTHIKKKTLDQRRKYTFISRRWEEKWARDGEGFNPKIFVQDKWGYILEQCNIYT